MIVRKLFPIRSFFHFRPTHIHTQTQRFTFKLNPGFRFKCSSPSKLFGIVGISSAVTLSLSPFISLKKSQPDKLPDIPPDPISDIPPSAAPDIPQNTVSDKHEAQTKSEQTISKQTSVKALLAHLSAHLSHNWKLLVAIIAVSAASAAANILAPIVVGQLVSVIQSILAADKQPITAIFASIRRPAARLVAIFAAQSILAFLDAALVSQLGENIALALRRDLFAAFLRQDIAFFDSHRHADLIARLSQDVADFKHTFKLVITQGLKSVSQITGAIYTLSSLSPKLTLVLVSTMPFVYVLMNIYGNYLRKLSVEARRADTHATSIASEALSNIRTVRAFASESTELKRYVDAASTASSLSSFLGFHIGLFNGMTIAAVSSMMLIVVSYGGNLVIQGAMTPGQLVAYLVSTQSTERAFAQLGVLFAQSLKALGSASRVFEYIHHQPSIPLTHKDNSSLPTHLTGHIEFRDVKFAYPSRSNVTVLDRFSLDIPAGHVIALCGSSGSGKSTIGQLIERFYDPLSGEILIDGIPLRDLDPSWMRRHIGYIGQEPVLFASSIRDNIRYGCPDATDDEVCAAAAQANATEFIESFPNGYDTLVGERGVALSGGQKQRIAIARAILTNPRILILDEATSALDTASERVVQDALESLMREHKRTVIVIAHRLSTVQNADKIVVMCPTVKRGEYGDHGAGNIVETGTFDELMKRRGAFYRLSQHGDIHE